MDEFLTVSQAARELAAEMGVSVPPRSISDLFYQRKLPDDLAPVIGGRRLIARDCLPRIRDALIAEGTDKTKFESFRHNPVRSRTQQIDQDRRTHQECKNGIQQGKHRARFK